MGSMTRDNALQRFQSERVAVLGTTGENGAPHLVPVTFAVTDGSVVFAVDHKPKTTGRLRRLDNIARNPQVSFLAEEYSDDWEELWWVRVDADAEIVAEGRHRLRALDALAAKYHQYREFRPSGVVVLSRIRTVTGWTVRSADT